MTLVTNPILPGFHPDPSICRVGEDYYLATSTFEWWPGVRLHHSRDLANWSLVGYALTRRSQLDMRGNPDSGGVWAPCLSHADGRFWLVYTDAKSLLGPFKDLRNYLVTAPSIEGPWSEPVRLNASGFDPSLYHAPDGRKWLVSMAWQPQVDARAFEGIYLQEFSPEKGALVGPKTKIFAGSSLGITEGPHLYFKDGYHYLVTAEGGTGFEHAVTVARARDLFGPYELHPANPLLSSRESPETVLQKAGHASFVQAVDGHWYLVHLCSRPSKPSRRCILGRETALQALDWEKGDWPSLSGGGRLPRLQTEVPGVTQARPYLERFHDDFDAPVLQAQWNSLREPLEAPWLSLSERPGFLRLRGRHSLQSTFDQSSLGFRLLHPRCRVATRLDFAPKSCRQQAGLSLYYNTSEFYYAFVGRSVEGALGLRLLACDSRRFRELLPQPVPLAESLPVELEAKLEGESLQFAFRQGDTWAPLGPVLDASILSDDYPVETGLGWAFTGTFAVLCAQDSDDSEVTADFDWFAYEAISDTPTTPP